jgi:hypothetical protein
MSVRGLLSVWCASVCVSKLVKPYSLSCVVPSRKDAKSHVTPDTRATWHQHSHGYFDTLQNKSAPSQRKLHDNGALLR